MIQRLHKLSPLLSFMFVRYSGDLIVHLWQGGRGKVLDLRSSRALIFSNISVGTGSVLSQCRPEGMWCDVALRIMTRKIFSPFWQLVGNRLLLSLSSISLLYRSQFSFFMLMLERCCIGLIVTYICKLMRNSRWSEPRFVFVCQLVEVIREADDNENLGWHCPEILLVKPS